MYFMTSPQSRATGTVGDRVREQRRKLGISQETLAELAGLHWTFVGQVERGQRNLSLHNLIKLAGGLDVDPGTLVAGITPKDLPEVEAGASDAERIRATRKGAL
jgi:transcriptional regulator with XRE-family HTH domain